MLDEQIESGREFQTVVQLHEKSENRNYTLFILMSFNNFYLYNLLSFCISVVGLSKDNELNLFNETFGICKL